MYGDNECDDGEYDDDDDVYGGDGEYGDGDDEYGDSEDEYRDGDENLQPNGDPYLLCWASSYRWQSLALAEPGATYDKTTGWALDGSEVSHSAALSASL